MPVMIEFYPGLPEHEVRIERRKRYTLTPRSNKVVKNICSELGIPENL